MRRTLIGLIVRLILIIALSACSGPSTLGESENTSYVQPVAKGIGSYGSAPTEALVNVVPYHWRSHTVLDEVVVVLEDVGGKPSRVKGFTSRILSAGSYKVSVSPPEGSGGRETSIDLKDALATLKLAIGIESINDTDASGKTIEVSAYQRTAADFNADGRIDLKDALEILKYSIGVPVSSSARWQYFHDTEVIAPGATPRVELAGAKSAVELPSGVTSIGVAGVLMGDVDGSWRPSQTTAQVDPAYYGNLVSRLQPTDKSVTLARWGISNGDTSATKAVISRTFQDGVETITYSDGSQVKSGSRSFSVSFSVDGLFKYLTYNYFDQLVQSSVEFIGPQEPNIIAGETFNCVLTNAGGVKCIGTNRDGQIGNGVTCPITPYVGLPCGPPVASFTDVVGLGSGVQQIATIDAGNCVYALKIDGSVFAWGLCSQFGLNRTATPVQIPGLSGGVVRLASGGGPCVLLVDATPKCVLDSKYEWKRIDELGGVSEIAASAGGGNVCVLLLTGDPKCWGFNAGNGVDPNTGARTTVPTIPSGINGGVTSVSIGSSNSCILMNTGGIKCWGSMMSGQFPSTAGYVPFNGEILTPGGAYSEYMPGLGAGVQAVSQGYNFQCALMAAGGVKCWGANGYGQHGDNTIGNSSVLTISDVSGLTTGVYKVATATTHACVLKIDGSIYCWGANIYGQFGIANQLYALTPVLIPGVSPSLMRKI